MRNFIGEQGFIWFIGTVVDRNDPLKMGRVRVRCYGWHTEDVSQISNDDLPWAVVMTPTTSHSTLGVGESPDLQVGAWVVGFFMDGRRAQEPCIMGSLPTSNLNEQEERVSDIHPLAKGTNTIKYDVDKSINEPESPYAAEYPYNKVMATEGGHTKEYDNTKKKERIREAHVTGTLYEVHPDGSKVVRVVGNNYVVIAGNDSVKVSGNAKLVIDGNLNITVGGNAKLDIGGTTNITSGGNMALKAPRIDLN
jgi:hypothetical protein